MKDDDENATHTFEHLAVAAARVLNKLDAGLACPGDRHAGDYSEFAAKHSLNPRPLLQLEFQFTGRLPQSRVPIPVMRPCQPSAIRMLAGAIRGRARIL